MKCTLFTVLIAVLLGACTAAPTPAPTATPEPTATITPSPTATIVPTPTHVGGGSGRFIFELTRDQFHEQFPELDGEINLFVSNAAATNVVPVTNGLRGYNYFKGLSPDGTHAFVASATDEFFERDPDASLFLLDLREGDSQPILITKGLPSQARLSNVAVWLDELHIAYIGRAEAGSGIYISMPDGSEAREIYPYDGEGPARKPAGILGAGRNAIYWYSEVRVGNSRKDLVWQSASDGSSSGPVLYGGEQLTYNWLRTPLALSPNGSMLAWGRNRPTREAPPPALLIAPIDNIEAAQVLELNVAPRYLRWAPDGNRLLAKVEDRVFSQSPQQGILQVSVPTMDQTWLPDAGVIVRRSQGCGSSLDDFSPDGRQILVTLPDHLSDQGYCRFRAAVLNLETLEYTDILPGYTFSSRATYWFP